MKRSLLIVCIALFLCTAVSCSYVSDAIGGIIGDNGDNDQAGIPGIDVIIPDNDITQTPDDVEKPDLPGEELPEEENPELPEEIVVGNTVTGEVADVLDEKNALASNVDLVSDNGLISATLPEGALVAEGATSLTFSVKELEESAADITLAENESSLSVDVHIEGLSPDNETVIKVYIKALLPIGLNMGNYSLYHVENGETVLMTLLGDEEPVHNSFEYDPVTGDTTMYLKSFSEIALVSNEVNPWEGNLDYSWFTAGKGEYTIANADQLAAFSAIVGGMSVGKDAEGNLLFAHTYTETEDGVEYTYHDYSFAGETVTLIADINLGDAESDNKSNIIFYPIGYWNSDETYEKTNKAISSGFYTFEGTFDGNGNTISNFYQNTWEMKGDHNWYDATLQYYRDGMGLFGKVYGATIKNLTVENFSSDGEIATTGVIAAYAEGATFENIAIFNCNPRVYNIGNGGIVGCVGWYAKEEGLKTTFTNITVDNSNKISALWGSYDVACGGIVGQYYPTSGQTSAGTPKNAGIEMTNCHVAAQMDVYNDVCANYQYYAYRYTGMLIGSVRENETIDGRVYPKMDGITASGCTVHFGDWNDYYYCEIVANTTASYTHDHQMSRLTQVAKVDGTTITYLDGTTGTVPTSGWAHYVVVMGKDANGKWIHGDGSNYATCYHFNNGEVWTHEMAGYHNGENGEKFIDENGDSIADLKEDKQLVYREFKQLFTGYGWGVTSKGIDDVAGVTILDHAAESITKFEKNESDVTEYQTGTTVTIGDLFSAVNDLSIAIKDKNVLVTVSPVEEDNTTLKAAFVPNTSDWTQGTLTFSGVGEAAVTISDYYFCIKTTIIINVTAIEKFDVVMNNGDFLHRVGNSGTVALDKLFKAKDGVTVGTVSVAFEAVGGTGASGTYSNNAIQFSGTGVVKVTITDNDCCIPTVLYLEVVDAKNYSGATGESLNATSNNVVLLNNIGSGFTVSDGYTVFGNGFTLNYTSDGRYLNNGLKQGVVMVENGGTLDNLRINASIYPTAFMYYGTTQVGDYVQQDSNPREVDGDKTRYYYQLSAVATYGDATISNCYIYGGRTNIFVNTGNVTIEDSILECGVVANVQIQSSSKYTVTLDNTTTIQYQVKATVGDTSKVMLGAGVLVGPETTSNPTIVLNGEFKQYNWVNADDKTVVSGTMPQMIIQGALDATAYNHTINGKTSSNLGIIFMNEEEINITNNTSLPYEIGTVTMTLDNEGSITGQVYSLQGATEGQIYSDYANADRNTVNGDYIPRFVFDLGDQEISYDGSEDTRYLYGDSSGVSALYKDGETALTLDLTKLATIYKYSGKSYVVTPVCINADGDTVTSNNGVVTLNAQGNYTLVFTVNDNLFYNQNGETIEKSVVRTYTVPVSLTVKAADIKNATVEITKTTLDGVYTTVNLTDYKLRINFLNCITITDYDNTGAGTTVDLTSNISSATLTPASVNVFTTDSTITITYTDGRVLTVNFSKISGSSPGTKTAVCNTSGGVYFITEGALDNKPTESSSQNICTITSVSFKGNSGSEVINDNDVVVTWALGSSSSGCFAEGTMITLANGTQKPIEQITYEDELIAWDFNTGAYTVTVPSLIEAHKAGEYRVINLKFADGTVARVIVDHGFFDVEANNFVYIDEENVDSYIGHQFVKVGANGTYESVELIEYEITIENVSYYTIQTAIYNNCIAENMFTLTSPPEMLDNDEWFDYFEIGVDMKYDEEKMQADIEKYGLYTYEDFAEYVTYEQFIAFNGPYLKVLVGRGVVTYEQIIDLISMYVPQ